MGHDDDDDEQQEIDRADPDVRVSGVSFARSGSFVQELIWLPRR